MNRIINMSLLELKDKKFSELVNLYQNIESGVLIKFRNFEKEYCRLRIKKKISESKEFNEAFLMISEAFFHQYNLLWNQYKVKQSDLLKIKMDDARIFFESCNIHVSKINTHYLQPLTIKKANRSIIWGIVSVLIGLIAIILSIIFTWDTNNANRKFETKLINQEILLNDIKKNLYVTPPYSKEQPESQSCFDSSKHDVNYNDQYSKTCK